MIEALDLEILSFLWLSIAVFIGWMTWKRRTRGTGLVLTYVLLFTLGHWLTASLFLLPWYSPAYDSIATHRGFVQSFYGVVGLAIGILLLAPALRRLGPMQRPLSRSHLDVTPDRRLPGVYIFLGLLAFFVLAPVGARVPTFSAFVSSLSSLLLVGLVLKCWLAWQARNPLALIRWILLASVWPFVIVGTQGFLGAGLSVLLTLLLFVFQLVGPRKRLVLFSLALFYAGMSVYVTYMQARTEIRAVVWSDEVTVEDRFDAVESAIRKYQWFNPRDEDHLYLVDMRMNENFLVGAATQMLEAGYFDYVRGKTLWNMMIMLVPRALWPDKPLTVGGSARVTEYTGIVYYGDTSVGMGQVLEFFVNFGTVGVAIGLAILGALLALIDEFAAIHLRQGDFPGFAFWYLPALSLLRPDNDLFVLVGGFVSGLITMALLNRVLPIVLTSKPILESDPEVLPTSVTRPGAPIPVVSRHRHPVSNRAPTRWRDGENG